MEQVRKLIAALSVVQRAGIVAAAVLTIAGVFSFVHWRHEQGFKPLFTGMAPDDAAAIVQKLKESGVEYRLADNGSAVLVPEAKVDELRLELAGAGLPRTGRVGFELFDKTNIGITDFTERVNYRRALEGELERSIKVLTEIEQARVHISFPKDSVFLDAREPAKASVLVTLRPGKWLSDQNVLAITNLVASAVEGLNPEFVSVVDMQGNLLSRPKRATADGAENSDAALEYKRQIEKDLLAKVDSTLAPLLGEGRFRAGISVDCDLTTTEQTDEVFDPTRSVMVTSQKSEDVTGGSQPAGVPGTASNLPRPPVQSVGTRTGMSRRTENASYETSRSVKQVKTPHGSIKRLSASVLLAQELRWEGRGKQRKQVPVPVSPETLKAIHDIVAGVIGLDPSRGDQLVLESLPFERDLESGNAGPGREETPPQPVPPSWKELMQDKRVLIGAGSVALLVAAAAVVLAIRRRKAKALEKADEATARKAELAAAEQRDAITSGDAKAKLQLTAAGQTLEECRKGLQETVSKEPVIAASVLRGWLEENGA
ncbi:MAG: flagellar M-ring protein FliF [Acidobacteriaceae bacterium]|nr:flagellar M-ring protein FliF [Acidobacteriaceae bacterium]